MNSFSLSLKSQPFISQIMMPTKNHHQQEEEPFEILMKENSSTS
jgi:hypothetical protein